MIRALCLALGLAASAATAGAAPAPLRLLVEGTPPGPCAPVTAGDAALAAYAGRLAQRLERPVLACPVADKGAAAKALASGGGDLALLDPAAFASAGPTVRAILAPRISSDFGRVEIVFASLKTSSRSGLTGLTGARLQLAGTAPLAAEAPLRVAADSGLTAAAFKAVMPGRSPEEAVAALRAGRVDLAAFHAAAWRRLCRADAPGEEPCKDLKVVYAARPQARLAFVAPLSMPDDLRYRLIGIHMALHLEAPSAFAYVARIAPGAVSVDPAEASALAPRAP